MKVAYGASGSYALLLGARQQTTIDDACQPLLIPPAKENCLLLRAKLRENWEIFGRTCGGRNYEIQLLHLVLDVMLLRNGDDLDNDYGYGSVAS